MLVILKKDLTSKLGSYHLSKGTIFSYDPATASIIIQFGRMQVHMGVKLGKDVQELDWVEVKRSGAKIKQTPGKGITFEKEKRTTNGNTNRKGQIA